MCPDSAGQPGASALLHELEQHRPLSSLLPAPRTGFHCGPTGICLEAALASTRAARATRLDHGVTDLAGRAATEPRLSLQDHPAADTGTPEDTEQRPVWAPRPEMELGLGGHLDVVADEHPGAERRRQRLAQRKAPNPARQVAGARNHARSAVHDAR